MFRVRRIVAFSLFFTCAVVAHAQQSLRVAAAADLQPLLPKILAEFSAQTGVRTQASYKSSATLATAIINGAPFDLFLAADFSFPQRVIDAGRAEGSAPVPYARGTLVLWARKDGAFGAFSLDSLRSPALHSLAIANPQHAPYGRAAEATLRNLGLYDRLKPKLVVAENIAQAAQFADSGNAQLGFISLTSALTPRLKASGHFVVVPGDDYPPLLQGAVVVRGSANAKAARQFLTYLGSAAVARQLEAGGLASAH